MRKIILSFIAATLLAGVACAKDYGAYYSNMPVQMPVVSAPSIPDNTVNIKDFGGVGDGQTLNTEAFRKAISALEKQGGGHIVVPAGIWMSEDPLCEGKERQERHQMHADD